MLPEIVPNVSIQNTTVSSIKQLTSRIVQIKFDRSRSFRASSSTNTSMDISNIGRRSTSSISTRLHNLNLSSKIPQARYTIQTEATSENQGESSEENTVQVDLPVSRIYSTTTNNPLPTLRVFTSEYQIDKESLGKEFYTEHNQPKRQWFFDNFKGEPRKVIQETFYSFLGRKNNTFTSLTGPRSML